MKKYLFSLTIIIFFSSIFFVEGQDVYYYFDGSEIYLNRDSNSVVLFFKEEYSFKNTESTFTNSSIIDMYVPGDYAEDSLMARLTAITSIKDIPIFLGTMGILVSELSGFSYGYKTFDGSSCWPTMKIVFRLNQGKTINDISEFLVQYNATFISEKYGVFIYKVSNIIDVFDLANYIFENGYAQWAEPDLSANVTFSTDPLYIDQFYLNNFSQTIDGVLCTNDIDIDAPEAWSISLGSPNIKVAVIDEGVEDHEDLRDENNSSRVLSGYSVNCLLNCDGRPKASNKHGQPIAGIIAASHNNIGIRGIAPNVKIIPISINSATTASHIAISIGKAWDDFGADVLSCSWSWPTLSNNIVDAINIARANGRYGKGSVVVFASGNDRSPSNISMVSFPANTPGVLAVGAVSKLGVLSTYSNGGPELSVVAPSSPNSSIKDIRTIDRMGNAGYNNGNYMTNFSGTSAACPQVAGVAALLLSVDPSLTESEVYCRITISSTDMGPAGRDDDFGYGRLNAYYTIALTDMLIENKVFVGVQKFTASNTVTIGPNTVFENSGPWLSNVEVVAGNRIIAKYGSSSENGTYFHAYISDQGPCGFGPRNMLVNNDTLYSEENKTKIDKNNIFSLENTLFQIYPNPFSNSFTVSISQPEETDAKIYLTDAYGRQVLGIFSGSFGKGQHSIDVSTDGITKGLYFCVMETPAGRNVVKVIKTE